MATITYDLLGSASLTSPTSFIIFNSIPQTYTDLILIVNARSTSTSGIKPIMRFNDDATSGAYTYNYMAGTVGFIGTSGGSNSYIGTHFISTFPNSFHGTHRFDIMNYKSSSDYKPVIGRFAQINEFSVETQFGEWRNSNPITKISYFVNNYSFETGSTFYLYGVL